MSVSATDALNKLREGNGKFVNDEENIQVTTQMRAELTGGQSPYAIILSCADSRVLPESIFDANVGEFFVVRVAGNIANTSSIASIEYAVAHLGTKLIVVLGHESCGAVGAALGGGNNGYNLNHLMSHITPALASSSSTEVNDVVRTNASLNAKELISRSSIISNAVANEGVEIKSAFYNLGSGKVDFLD